MDIVYLIDFAVVGVLGGVLGVFVAWSEHRVKQYLKRRRER